MNLSNYPLSKIDTQLLDRGLTFIPTYLLQPLRDIYTLQHRLIRNLKLKDYYSKPDLTSPSTQPPDDDHDFHKPTFRAPSTWTPPDHKISQPTLDTIQRITSSTESLIGNHEIIKQDNIRLNSFHDNLSHPERLALKQLQHNADIVIKPADKGSAVVVMTKSSYIREAMRQLNNPRFYKKLDTPVFPSNIPKINQILTNMYRDGYIDKKQLDFLSASDADRARRFYLLPKIHKPREKWPHPDMPDGRPIVSDSASESCRVSQYLDSHIRPISILHPSYIKDTYDFVQKVRDLRIPKDALLVTADVTSLYTNMEISRMIQCVKEAFHKFPSPNRPDHYLLELLELTLRNNDFTFNGDTYLQVCGTAMGKAYAPGLADLYLQYFDEKARTGFKVPPRHYFRYLDDIFLVWFGSVAELKEFETFLNSLIPGITVTFNYSDTSIDFLDTTIYTIPDPSDPGYKITKTRVFFKPTDTHQLLHKLSFHPRHTCLGVLKSQFLRFKRISSTKRDFDESSQILMRSLHFRGYSKRMMRKMKLEVWRLTDTRIGSTSNHTPILPIIVPYNQFGIQLSRQWRSAIGDNPLFSHLRLISAYTVGKNLHKFLVRSVLPNTEPVPIPIHSPVQTILAPIRDSCFRCTNGRCKVCAYITPCRTITSSKNGKRYKVKGHISCHSTNLIYLISCRRCNLQYVGETSTSLATRINNHLSCIRTKKPTPIGLHFNLPNHSVRCFSVSGVETFDSTTTTANINYRKLKEITWQHLLQTAHPLGLNNLKPHHLNG